MSKRIPPVRDWCVRFYRGNEMVCSDIVATINKRFARWMANERNGYIGHSCSSVTVTLVPQQKGR